MKLNAMKRLLFLIGLLLVTTVLFSQTRQRESYYQAEFAKIIGGEREVVLPDRTRVDIVTDEYAIEVDFAEKWAEGIGQALYYEKMLDKKAGILLIWEGEKEIRFLNRLMTVAVEHGIQVWVWNWTDDTWGRVDYKLQYLY
jgi:hypothetical protein